MVQSLYVDHPTIGKSRQVAPITWRQPSQGHLARQHCKCFLKCCTLCQWWACMSSLIPRHTKCLGMRQLSELLIILIACHWLTLHSDLAPFQGSWGLGMRLCRCIMKDALGYVVWFIELVKRARDHGLSNFSWKIWGISFVCTFITYDQFN